MPRARSMTACAATAATLATGLVAAPAASAAEPTPPPARRTPAGIEALAPYVKAVSCDPRVKPGVKAFGDLLLATYPGTWYSLHRPCGTDHMPTSEHYDSRALDWGVRANRPAENARAKAVINWLLAPDSAGRSAANARRLGMMYLIWDDKIWVPSSGWREYLGCSSKQSSRYDTYCHRDHIHFSFTWAGAMKRTSYWTGSVAAEDYGPCRPQDMNWAGLYEGPRSTRCRTYSRVNPSVGASANTRTLVIYSGMYVGPGSTGPVVTAVQRALGASADGRFGSGTAAAVSAFQARKGLRQTGDMNIPTWRALLASVGEGNGTTPEPEPDQPTPLPDDLSAYYDTVLQRGSRGQAVRVLQQALGMTANQVDGSFGSYTLSVVRDYQAAKGLPVTGVVDRAMWLKLDGKTNNAPKPPAPEPGGPLAPYYNVVLKRGSTGSAVKELQRQLGFTGSDVDGSFGAKTLGRVQDFQHQYRLKETGTVTRVMWIAMEKAPDVTPEQGKYSPWYGTTLKRGSRGEAVKVLQGALGFKGAEVDGSFGKLTMARVGAFQTDRGLKADGIVDKAVWVELGKGTWTPGNPGNPGNPEKPEKPAPEKPETNYVKRYDLSYYYKTKLTYGHKGGTVKILQRTLGFSGKKVDGSFGPKTKTALLAFQASRGLPRNAVVTPLVWKQLELQPKGVARPLAG